MSINYFVFGVYGVQVTGDFDRWLDQLMADEEERRDEAGEDFGGEERREFVADFANNEVVRQRLREECVARFWPVNLQLFWTGHDDDRPGVCDVEPGCWVYGLNLYDFPAKAKRITPEFAGTASWFTYVEASG